MGRRVAEAAKACRARRTRGETGLWRLVAVVFLVVVFFVVDWVVDVLWVADLVDLAAAFGDEEDDSGGADCATADWKRPKRTNETAKKQTTERRTQTLPTSGSWDP